MPLAEQEHEHNTGEDIAFLLPRLCFGLLVDVNELYIVHLKIGDELRDKEQYL